MFWHKAYFFLLISCYGTILTNSEVAPNANILTDLELKELCHGLEFQYLAHPTKQQNYVICVPGGGVERSCETDNCFDERNPPCSISCSSNTNVADQRTKDYCNDDATTLLDRVADDKDCESYYLCVGKNVDPLPQKCPPNQHYSEEHKTCRNFYEANCEASTKWCKKRRDGTRFPNEKCFQYYECKKEVTLMKSCMYGEHFNRDLGKCVSSICVDDKRVPDCKNTTDGVSLTHAKCYKYFVCLNRALFEAQCASGYYYDAGLSACIRDVNNVCNDV